MTKSKSKGKKGEKTREGAHTGPSSDNWGQVPPSSDRPPTPAASPLSVAAKNPLKPCFQSEIQSMMYAFGDSRKPSPESATLIEEIVWQQTSSMIIRAAEVTAMRGGRFMSIEDIIFLMRKDKEKLKKLIRFLNFKELKNKAQKQISQEDDEVLEAAVVDLKGAKKRKVSHDTLSAIDQTGDLISLFEDEETDEEKQEKNERMERFSRSLDPQLYLEFTECRQTNFNKKAGKFKEWIDCASLIDMKPNTPIMEVFSYLAYETVGQIVDLALLVKKDMEGGDALSSAMPVVSAMSQNQKAGLPNLVLPSSTASTPNHTPPGTPTTPTTNVAFMSSPSSSTTSVGSAVPAKAAKGKKRKAKNASGTLPEVSSDCIQPHHIREALRRYNNFLGPMVPFVPHARPTACYRTLCC